MGIYSVPSMKGTVALSPSEYGKISYADEPLSASTFFLNQS